MHALEWPSIKVDFLRLCLHLLFNIKLTIRFALSHKEVCVVLILQQQTEL